jgi:hypothetical protein
VIDFDRSEKDHSSRLRVRGVFKQPGSKRELRSSSLMSAFASCDTFALGRHGRVEDGRGSLGQATGRERVAAVEATVQLKRHIKLSL